MADQTHQELPPASHSAGLSWVRSIQTFCIAPVGHPHSCVHSGTVEVKRVSPQYFTGDLIGHFTGTRWAKLDKFIRWASPRRSDCTRAGTM
jgi:hypothetical protein